MNKIKCAFLVAGSFLLFACSSGVREEYAMNYKGQIGDPIIAIAMLSEQQYEWAGTPYVLGGQSRGGIDCSGLVRKGMINALFKLGVRNLSSKYLYEAFKIYIK